jgi:hypothetical protein
VFDVGAKIDIIAERESLADPSIRFKDNCSSLADHETPFG